jgi:hypothetical protein
MLRWDSRRRRCRILSFVVVVVWWWVVVVIGSERQGKVRSLCMWVLGGGRGISVSEYANSVMRVGWVQSWSA